MLLRALVVATLCAGLFPSVGGASELSAFEKPHIGNFSVLADSDEGIRSKTRTRLRGYAQRLGKSGVGRTQYTWGVDDYVSESVAGGPTRTFLQGPRMGMVLGVAEGTGTQLFAHDALGSIVARVDASNTTATTLQRFDAWGTLRGVPYVRPAAGQNQLAYTGHIFDPETGLHYAKARYLDNGLGRWLSQDPWLGSVFPNGVGVLLYARGNPVRFVDPTGTVDQETVDVVTRKAGDCLRDPGCKAAFVALAARRAAISAGWQAVTAALASSGGEVGVATFLGLGPIGWAVLGVLALGAGGAYLYWRDSDPDPLETAVENGPLGNDFTKRKTEDDCKKERAAERAACDQKYMQPKVPGVDAGAGVDFDGYEACLQEADAAFKRCLANVARWNIRTPRR